MTEPASKEDVRAILREELRPLWKRVDSLDREVRGHNGSVGLSTRVNVAEHGLQRVTWHMRTAWSTLLTAMVSGITWVLWR